MIVEQIWTGNSLRNFNYLLACPDTGEALAIDPLDYEKCLSKAKKKGWDITQILNTHEHGDHTGGNQAMISATKAKLLAHEKSNIPGMDIGLKSGDVVRIGKTVELLSLDTPGHTMSHVCLLSKTDQPSIFSGDTLFNAGVGNCHHGGHPEELYLTFTKQLAKLSNNTLIYPGHDYGYKSDISIRENINLSTFFSCKSDIRFYCISALICSQIRTSVLELEREKGIEPST